MQSFNYQARNTSTGDKVKGIVQADSEQAATKLIRKQGLTPLTISVQKERAMFGGNKVKTKDKVLFSRQLSTLINAGLPLVQSLRSVESQTTSKPLKAIINQVINDVESGQQFSESLAKHPKVFNKIFISLVAASETSGTLDKGLERLANQQEKDADITSRVRGAMIYPGIVLLVMIGVGSFMIIKVTKFWYLVIILLGLIGFLGTRWSRTIAGRDVIDGLKMKMWPISHLFMKLYMARFARTGTTLIASGVPLIQMLQISGESIDNVHISRTLAAATEKVKGGKSLSEALSGSPDFLDLVPNMIRIGEQSGSMETMMDKIAVYYEKEVDNEIKAISTIIEPVMMIIMGIMAFTLVAAILLPIYGLTNQAGFNGR